MASDVKAPNGLRPASAIFSRLATRPPARGPQTHKAPASILSATALARDKSYKAWHSADMDERYTIRPDATGYSVIDLESGSPAELAMTPQVGLSRADAEHTASQFNLREALVSAEVQPEPTPSDLSRSAA